MPGYAVFGRWRLTLFAIVTVGLPAMVFAAPETAPPPNSIYQLAIPLVDQNGRATQLADWRGRPILISMFYTSCEFVCPRIIEGLKRTEDRLSASGSGKLPVLLVSFDPARDDIKTLKHAAEERNLDEAVWSLARTDARNVRKLAALLGIQYRELPSGDFNHSSMLILLDADGRIVGRTSTIGEADPRFVKTIEGVIRKRRIP